VAGAPQGPAPYNWSGFFLGVSAPGTLWGETKWSFAGAAGGAADNYSGVLAGGGGGYNYQMGPYVIGGQVEWDWTNARGGESFSCPATASDSFNNCDTRVNSIFTATARLGYALDRLLVYGQGGLAVGDVTAKFVSDSFAPGSTTASASKTAVGWTIGAGFEFGLTQNISAKAEYLYFDLGSDTYNLGIPVAINRTGNIGRVGLNYRFDLM
jgi:outer membrane immunogenic protein